MEKRKLKNGEEMSDCEVFPHGNEGKEKSVKRVFVSLPHFQGMILACESCAEAFGVN